MSLDTIQRLYENAKMAISSSDANEARRKEIEKGAMAAEIAQVDKRIDEYTKGLHAKKLFEFAVDVDMGRCSDTSIRGKEDQSLVAARLSLRAAKLGHKTAFLRLENLLSKNPDLYRRYIFEGEIEFVNSISSSISNASSSKINKETQSRYALPFAASLQDRVSMLDPDSIYCLAELYRRGQGIDKDVNLAFKLHTIAIGLGHVDSKTPLNWLINSGELSAAPEESSGNSADSDSSLPSEVSNLHLPFVSSDVFVEDEDNDVASKTTASKIVVDVFIDHEDGTVTDTRTGLMWLRFPQGKTWSDRNCDGTAKKMSFYYATSLRRTFAGHDDWRLPSFEELGSIVNKSSKDPSIDVTVFPGTPSSEFWSSDNFGINFQYGDKVDPRNADPYMYVRLVRGVSSLQFITIETRGTGFGRVIGDMQQEKFIRGTTVIFKADAEEGSVFTGWSGDATGTEAICSLTVDRDKHIVADFEERSFGLRIEYTGMGSGIVKRSSRQGNGEVDIDYPAGSTVNLEAVAAQNSVFCGWGGTSGLATTESRVSVMMSEKKLISANFSIKPLRLTVVLDGAGSGFVTRTPEGDCQPEGTPVTLVATAEVGSQFAGWSGDFVDKAATCSITLDADKVVTARFCLLSFELSLTAAGTGSGFIKRSIESETYNYGSTVILEACAYEGSVFTGWTGDSCGLDSSCTVTIDSAKRIVAEFTRLDTSVMEVGVNFDMCESTKMKGGDSAFIFYLSITNNEKKQTSIEMPLCSYVSHAGEEVIQDVWLSGYVVGSDGASLRSGAFRKTGLVFYKPKLSLVSMGDCLYVTVLQPKQARRFNFSFRCVEASKPSFVLIASAVEYSGFPEEERASLVPPSEILRRLELLETGLASVLGRLDALENNGYSIDHAISDGDTPQLTLLEVVNWLGAQKRIPLTILRSRLLPFDLLPNAVLDDINERALDLLGEPALEEDGDEIVVFRDILAQVVVHWDHDKA